MVRLPDGMRDQIASAAAAAKRTMNAEIIARLEASFAQGEALTARPSNELDTLKKEFASLKKEVELLWDAYLDHSHLGDEGTLQLQAEGLRRLRAKTAK